MKTNKLFASFLGVCLFLPYWGIGQVGQSFKEENTFKINSKILPTRLQEAYDVKWCFLDLNVENNTTAISGNVTFKAQVVWPVMDTFSFHLYRECTIDSIYVNGERRYFVNREDERLIPDLALTQGQIFDIQVFYDRLVFPSSDGAGIFTGTYSNEFDVTWTHSTPNNTYKWLPVKQDLDDKIDSIWVFVTTSDINKVASNGLLTNVTSLPENRVRYEWKSNYPICYYLISIAVGNYQDYSFYAILPQTQDSILIQNYIYNSPDYLARKKDMIDETKDMIIFYSGIFGDYPFKKEKYGHAIVPYMAAMEHQTMTTMGSESLASISHELAHQWFGNNVTCGSWQHVWLNEGFATYSEVFWNEFVYGKKNASRIFADHIRQILEDIQTGSVYVPESEIDNRGRIFDSYLSYQKGASLLHMIRFELNNDDLFFNILKIYQQRFSGKTAVTDDFKEIVEELSGKDFTTFFNQWFYGEGYPIFNLTWEQSNGQLRIQSQQTTTASVTPFYQTSFEIKINYTDESHDTIRFFQENNNQVFTHVIPSGLTINSIEFDPAHWLLAKHAINEGSLSIKEERIARKFSLYPNPTNNIVNIQFDESLNGEKKIELINIEGQIIKRINTNARYYQLDISTLSPGIYQLVIYSNGEIGSQKLIKQ